VIQRAWKLPAFAAVAVALGLMWTPSAMAQKTTLPSSLNTSNPQSAFIKNQLRVAVDLGRKALAGFEASPGDDSMPIDEVTLQSARDTYVLIRAARHGMELAKANSRFPDPVLDLAFKRVDEAWNLARYPVDRASWGMNRQQYLQESIQNLSRAVRLLDQTLVIMP
jgi:hypothetical protein